MVFQGRSCLVSRKAVTLPFPHHTVAHLPAGGSGSSAVNALSSADRSLLHRLQTLALQYFLDNQIDNGLVLDRQSNRGPTRGDGLCSLAATGMGLIAFAVAAE